MSMSPEQRAAAAERLRQQWKDPEWRAKRRAGIRAAAERGKGNAAKSEANRRMWADPAKRKARMEAIQRACVERGNSEKFREIFVKLKADPAFEEKRARKCKEKQKQMALRMKVNGMLVARKRRGFDVPQHLWPEYRWLRKAKKLSAREAGQVLGLVRS